MEVISRANIYKKIELAKEFLKNVVACEDTVAVLDNIQGALEAEPVFNIDDEAEQNCLAVKKCSCGGILVLKNIKTYCYDDTFSVTFCCNKCNKVYRAMKNATLDEIVKNWNSECADEVVNNE